MREKLKKIFQETLEGTFDGLFSISVPINSHIHNVMNHKLYRFLACDSNIDLAKTSFDFCGIKGLYPVRIDIENEKAVVIFEYEKVCIYECDYVLMGRLAEATLTRG